MEINFPNFWQIISSETSSISFQIFRRSEFFKLWTQWTSKLCLFQMSAFLEIITRFHSDRISSFSWSTISVRTIRWCSFTSFRAKVPTLRRTLYTCEVWNGVNRTYFAETVYESWAKVLWRPTWTKFYAGGRFASRRHWARDWKGKHHSRRCEACRKGKCQSKSKMFEENGEQKKNGSRGQGKLFKEVKKDPKLFNPQTNWVLRFARKW